MRRLLGMVNVASTLFLRYPQVPVPGERSHRAFVVGIGDYISFGKLGKSVNDATDMATLLDAKGFCVSSVLNPTRSQFVEAFDKFCKDLGGARSVVVHYAGHGLAPLSESFLVAVDSRAGMPCADLLSVRRFVSVHPVRTLRTTAEAGTRERRDERGGVGERERGGRVVVGDSTDKVWEGKPTCVRETRRV